MPMPHLFLQNRDEFKLPPLNTYTKLMKEPIIFDGRNCYSLEEVRKFNLEYHSIGRTSIMRTQKTEALV